MDEKGGIQCLGHWKWTTCSPLSYFCSGNFPKYLLSYREANSYYPRGLIVRKRSFANATNGWDRGLQCLGHSNWTTYSHLSYFCSGNFQKYLLSYWEANSYYPRGLIGRVGSRACMVSLTGQIFRTGHNDCDRLNDRSWPVWLTLGFIAQIVCLKGL